MTEATPFLRKYDITFLCPPTITPRAFNRMTQSGGFGRTPAGAYTFSSNVVFETLRVVNQACSPPASPASKRFCVEVWVLDTSISSLN